MNEYSGILVTLWYCPNEKIKKINGTLFKSTRSTFDFEPIPKRYSVRSRVIKLDSKHVLFCSPVKGIPRITKRRFNSFFELLQSGDINIAFSSPEILTLIKQHIDQLPEPLNNFVGKSLRGKKMPEPNFSPEHLEILKRWTEYVFAKFPKDQT